MKNRNAARTALYSVLFGGLLGFSVAGLAQSEALETLNADAFQKAPAETAAQYPRANALATALDAHNQQDRVGRGPEVDGVADTTSPVSAVAVQAAADIDAYNARAGRGFEPQARALAGDANESVDPTVQQLAFRLARFNRTGGSLSD